MLKLKATMFQPIQMLSCSRFIFTVIQVSTQSLTSLILKDFLPSIHRNDILMHMYHSQPDLGTALDKSKKFLSISTCQTNLFITFRRIEDDNMSDIVQFLFVL